MGKKKRSDEPEEEEAAGTSALASLFSATNPFRRKPHTTDCGIQEIPKEINKPASPESRLLFKKQKSGGEIAPIEAAGEEENDGRKKTKNKRKRDEVEAQYERKMYGGTEGDSNIVDPNADGKVILGRKRKKEEAERDGTDGQQGELTFDDESKLLRTVFVGNLPLATTRKAVLREFSKFGEIESARIRSVPIADTKAPRKTAIIKGKINEAVDSVHAYVVFKDEQSARTALAHNMTKFGGNHIRVDMACPPRKKLKGKAPIYSVKKTVFIGNLPFDVKDEELYKLFCEEHQMESSLEAVRVIRDPNTSLGKGIAYIMFKTREAANLVVKKKGIKLRDRELRLSHARPDSTPSKPSHGSAEFSKKRKPDFSLQTARTSKVDRSASSSYEGLRSSKSGVPKKAPWVNRPRSSDSEGYKASVGGVRTQKRPAVAARKALALSQMQNKRKAESHMPQNSRYHKKARVS